MKVWPATLPQRMNVQGFQTAIGDGRLRSQNDAGGAKTRRRFSYVPRPLTCAFTASPEQIAILDAFVADDLGGGVLPFQMPAQLPVWQQVNGVWTVKFADALPQMVPIGGLAWTVTMQMVVLP